MRVKGNHPLAEVIVKALDGIDLVSDEEINEMVSRACMAAVDWHEKVDQAEVNDIINQGGWQREAIQSIESLIACEKNKCKECKEDLRILFDLIKSISKECETT